MCASTLSFQNLYKQLGKMEIYSSFLNVSFIHQHDVIWCVNIALEGSSMADSKSNFLMGESIYLSIYGKKYPSVRQEMQCS